MITLQFYIIIKQRRKQPPVWKSGREGDAVDVQTFCTQVLKVTEPDALQQCIGAIQVMNLRKGQVLLACGESPADVYFLKKGVLRGYYFDENGREITECISGTPGMSFMPSWDWHEPARINIGAAAAGTQVFAIPVALADDMLATRPESMQVYVEQIKLAGEIHLKARNALLEGAAPQRYQWFLQTYPGVADQVSGKIIASFLGITPVTLSRLRRSMRQEAQEAGGGRNDPT